MARYEIKRCILDNVNGHHLLRGQVIETEDTAWVARFGSDIRKVDVIPPNTKVMSIAGTEEGAFGQVNKVELEKQPEKEAPKREVVPKVVTRQQTKVVTGKTSDAK